MSAVNACLCANNFSLEVEKSSFVIFHPPQRKGIQSFDLTINGKQLKQDSWIKYLGVLIDSSLNWKPQIAYITN